MMALNHLFRTAIDRAICSGLAAARAIAVAVVCLLTSLSPAGASSFVLEFAPRSTTEIEADLPDLPASFPGAKFLRTGFSTFSGDWKIIRVERAESCTKDICPTIISHSQSNWKVMVFAGPKVEGTHYFKITEFSQVNLEGKNGEAIVARYDEKYHIIMLK